MPARAPSSQTEQGASEVLVSQRFQKRPSGAGLAKKKTQRQPLFLTAAENANVHIVQKRALVLGQTLNCSRIDFKIVDEARYAARNDGA